MTSASNLYLCNLPFTQNSSTFPNYAKNNIQKAKAGIFPELPVIDKEQCLRLGAEMIFSKAMQ